MATGTRSTLALLLLLFAMFPLHAIGGRHPDSAGITPTTLIPDTPAGRRAGEGSGSMLEDDAKFQAGSAESAASLRKLNRAHWGKKKKGSSRQVGAAGDDDHGHTRLLVGSSAPTCQGKCGQCNPCNPIHMTIGIPHGTVTQQEYYPEVWRCKCGGVYFMP